MLSIAEREEASRRGLGGRGRSLISRLDLLPGQAREGESTCPLRPTSHLEARRVHFRVFHPVRAAVELSLREADEGYLARVLPQRGQVSGFVFAGWVPVRRRIRTTGVMTVGLMPVSRKLAVMMMMVVLVEVQVRYEVVLAYAAHNRLPHLPPIVPHPLQNAEGESREQTRREDEESRVDVGEPCAVEGGERRAVRHRRQHLLRYPVQDTVLAYAQYAANNLQRYCLCSL